MATATGLNRTGDCLENAQCYASWWRERNWGRRVSKLARELEVTRVRALIDRASWPQKIPRDRYIVIWGSPGATPEAREGLF
jgi:hypothetical protein